MPAHPRTSPPPVSAAVVRGERAEDTPGLLTTALDAVGFEDALAAAPAEHRGAIVLIAATSPAPVDARLVEELVDLLVDRRVAPVTVGASRTALDRDRGVTDIVGIVGAAGFRRTTPRGRAYQVVDLDVDAVVVADLPASSVLHGRPVARRWVESGFRVVVSRCSTDPVDGFALCLDTLARVAPPVPGADPADVVTDLLEHLPPNLAIVDAGVSSHGPRGSRTLDPWETATVLAGTDALLVDIVGARLQGVDPAVSRPVARAMKRLGLPEAPRILGDTTPFAGWRPADALVRDAAQGVGRSPALARVFALATGPTPDAADEVVDRLHRLLAPIAGGEDPAGRFWLVWAHQAASAVSTQLRGWRTLYAKDSIDRVEVPLGIDLDTYTAPDYLAVPTHLALHEHLLDAAGAGGGALRWQHLDRSVVFEARRVVEAPFAAFVARVDIAAGISLMADYLGGRRVAVAHDDAGRVVMQAERNVYLPQPGYLAFWAGEPIDVCKIELVEYGDRRHRLMWRTVSSPNGSAERDDGALTFAATDDDRTLVTVRGRQRFTLPPFWECVDLDRFPEVRDPLIDDAYRRFFTATFDNLEACFEGRAFRIGRPAADPDAPPPTAAVAMLLEFARSWLADGRDRAAHQRPDVDEHGFRHFTAARPAGRDRPASGPPWWRRLADEVTIALDADRSRSHRW